VSPIVKPCRCGALIDRQLKFCPTCQRADDQRRNEKRKSSGRRTPAWERLRGLAIARAGNTCADCGKVLPKALLHAHLDPRLGGEHRGATLEDITVLCASCHGSRDAPRAHSAPHLHVVPRSDGVFLG